MKLFIFCVIQIYITCVILRCSNLIKINNKLRDIALKEIRKNVLNNIDWYLKWNFINFIFNPLTYYMFTTKSIHNYLIKRTKNEKI